MEASLLALALALFDLGKGDFPIGRTFGIEAAVSCKRHREIFHRHSEMNFSAGSLRLCRASHSHGTFH